MPLPFNRFDCFSEDLCKKVHNLDTDNLRVFLSNTAPNAATMTVKADLTEIAAGNGYNSGGHNADAFTSRTGAVTTLVGDPIELVASGQIGPFRYAVLYNDAPVSNPLIGWWDYGTSVTLQAGGRLYIDLAGGIVSISPDTVLPAFIDAESGSVVIAAPPANLIYIPPNYFLNADSGSIAITGTAATLDYDSGSPNIIFRGDFEEGTIPGDFQAYSVNGTGSSITSVTVASQGIPAAVVGHLRCGKATSGGTTANDFARVHFVHTTFGIPTWGEGTDIWFSGRFYFEDGFFTRKTSTNDLLRWDAYVNGSNDIQGGLGMSQTDDFLLITSQFPQSYPLITSYAPPEETWLHFEVHQIISQFDGVAFNEIFVDGVSKGSSTNANFKGTAYPANERAINRLRMGYVSESSAQAANTVYIDDMVISNGQVGP